MLEQVVRRTMAMDFNVDKKGDWDWGAGVALYGLRKAYEKTGNPQIYKFIQGFVDSNMAGGRPIPFNVNTTAPLLSVLLLYRETRDARYLEFAAGFARWLMEEAPRLLNGALEHTVINDSFAGQMWVDTVFMAGVFLTELGQLTGEDRYIKEGLRQARLHVETLQDGASGLLYHGYSLSTNDYLSGCLWARGNSWVTIAIPEILGIVEGYDQEKEWFRSAIGRQVKGLAAVQSSKGLWHTILNDPGSYEETSAAAGIVYGMLRLGAMGILEEQELALARKGFQAVIERIAADGTVQQVSAGTGIQSAVEDYNRIPADAIMPWGQGMALMMLSVCGN
jgi:unsaturated rhamnogalacturonyl hydrolase